MEIERHVLKKQIAEHRLLAYASEMWMDELSKNTITKYLSDIKQWLNECEETIEKESLLHYKENLSDKYKPSSINSKIIAINRYLRYLGFEELALKTNKIQQADSLDNIISKEQYERMLSYAAFHNKKKSYYIMKTIAKTGIRVSELKYITLEAVKQGVVVVKNKGKIRKVCLDESLCEKLLEYCEEHNIKQGIIFSGKEKGKAIVPEAVWKSMKYIARMADVPEEVVYPHALRHLFAKEYMRTYANLPELADILGHSKLETTRIYTKTSSDEKREKISHLEL